MEEEKRIVNKVAKQMDGTSTGMKLGKRKLGQIN